MYGIVKLCACSFAAQMGAGGAAAPAATGGGAAGGQQDYSEAWADYYRQQAAYYEQTGQAPGQGTCQ